MRKEIKALEEQRLLKQIEKEDHMIFNHLRENLSRE